MLRTGLITNDEKPKPTKATGGIQAHVLLCKCLTVSGTAVISFFMVSALARLLVSETCALALIVIKHNKVNAIFFTGKFYPD